MKHEEFGSPDDYFRAFRAIIDEGLSEKERALLQAHFAAQDHTVTWTQLAENVGYAQGRAVNAAYGSLARRVAKVLGVEEKPEGFWLFVLVGHAKHRDAISGHTAFVLRRPVIEALTRLGVFTNETIELLPDEFDVSTPVREGTRCRVLVNAYERNPEARRRCVAAHGTTCCICKFSFGAFYGPVADGYIHVHHIRALSEIGGEYVVDPLEDLRPVCPNCHAVLHLGGRNRTIEEVRQLLAVQGKG
jgi:5-methylcytosine-specific restriction protein A